MVGPQYDINVSVSYHFGFDEQRACRFKFHGGIVYCLTIPCEEPDHSMLRLQTPDPRVRCEAAMLSRSLVYVS